MNWYRADLHIHSVLSPCGDLDMSPIRIINEAKKKNLDIIGITDHNSTFHSEVTMELGQKEGITVFPGVELNTMEEVHCLAFFENIDYTKKFQEYINQNMSGIKNNSTRFGMQLIVNEKEEIIGEVDDLLIAGLTVSIDEIERKVHEFDGIFIPAHVDRPMNGIYSQIGFIPENLKIDAIEISRTANLENLLNMRVELNEYNIIANSDAHYTNQIGCSSTEYFLEEPSFKEWIKALNNHGNRKIRL